MDYDKLIEHLRECGTYGFKQEECREAALAIETLRAENRRMNEVICSIPTEPDSGRTIGQYDKEMSMCAYLDDLEADLARVTAERDAAEKEITRLKAVMRENGVYTIPPKYPWGKPEWNW